MNVEIDWKFPTLYTKPSLDQLTDVVVSVLWLCTAKDTDTGTDSSMSGNQEIGQPDPESFIPYQTLTHDQVSSWVFQYIDKNSIENEVTSVLNSKLNNIILARDTTL